MTQSLEPATGVRILVVDDNADGAELVSVMLQHKGYDTRVANSGAAALKLARDFLPDVALLDLGLPMMDGFDLASRLQDMPELEGLRLVALVKPVSLIAVEAAVRVAAAD